MTNINACPNHLHVASDNATVGYYFGELHSVTPMNLHGHHPYISVRYTDGVRVDLDPRTASETARDIVSAIAKLGAIIDCSGAAADLGEQ